MAIRRFRLPPGGWYSYDLGAWHVIVLNSNCEQVGGCGRGSAQWRWLRADLAAHPGRCTLAYWHRPRFSFGLHGSSSTMQPGAYSWRFLPAGGGTFTDAGSAACR